MDAYDGAATEQQVELLKKTWNKKDIERLEYITNNAVSKNSENSSNRANSAEQKLQ